MDAIRLSRSRSIARGGFLAIALLLCARFNPIAAQERSGALGAFEGQSDVGNVEPPGATHYDQGTDVYTLTAAGANTWYHVDNFHYTWKKMSGDAALSAVISFPPQQYAHDPNPHRKAMLMFRQSLDPGAVYVDVAQHGSGMTALQYRRERGANTEDIELNVDAPRTIRIEKRGDTFTLFLSMHGEALHQVGASVRLQLREPFFVGLGAVSHDVSTTDTVAFSHVGLEPLPALAPAASVTLYSTLQTVQIEDQYRRAAVIRTVQGSMQSANWAPDRKSIYVYEEGQILKIPYLTPEGGGAPQTIDVGTLRGCSGNFGLSPDGKSLAVSCTSTADGRHQVFVLPASGGGGTPRPVTTGAASSFFHAWSPDSRIIAFTRGRADKADIFTIPATGGAEVRLTRDTVNDGPDYTPDGKYIYFDSSRSGTTQIWRMRPDGSLPEQVTDDDCINSSPHVSPDGRTVAFLSQPPAAGSGITDAALKVIGASDGLIRTVAKFRGDRGSLSMYSWGDANHVAFVSYQLLPSADDLNRSQK